MFSRRDIAEDVRRLGVRRGQGLIVHSSYKSIGGVDGGPAAVIEALMDVVLPEGALLLPNLNIPHEFTAENPPRFDLKRDSVRKLGIIPELFKFGYAEHFSIHPTHSLMGVGEKAPAITEGHERAGVPCGPGTPWEKNARSGGKVLFIGVGYGSNTTCHSVEEAIPDSYRLSRDVIRGVVVLDGEERIVPSRLHVWGIRADFERFVPELEERGISRRGPVGRAPSICLDAGGFLDLALEKLRRDGGYFLKR